jgi:hypothetical protein
LTRTCRASFGATCRSFISERFKNKVGHPFRTAQAQEIDGRLLINDGIDLLPQNLPRMPIRTIWWAARRASAAVML